MPSLPLATRLNRRNASSERIADDVIADGRLAELLDCLAHETARIRYGAAKVVRTISEQAPETLLPRFSFFVDLLRHENRILTWEALFVLGRLAAVSPRQRIDTVLDDITAPLRGPELITAANSVKCLGQIAQARPDLVGRVTNELMSVERGRYKTPMCREICLGHAIAELNGLLPRLARAKRVENFVRRQLSGPRPSTRKRAEQFLKRWERTAVAT